MKIIESFKKIRLRLVVLFAATLYIVTAYNSHGFFHADEHYQIIEFAGLKLGTNTPNELAWEYKAQIRPSLQPVICYSLFTFCEFLGIDNPYSRAFLLRLITALLSIAIITFFIVQTQNVVVGESNKFVYYLLSFFLWFTPLISVRFSSETWSGILFLLAISCFKLEFNKLFKPFIIGAILGFSFLCRFQIAFAILGFGLWLLFINRSDIKYLLKLAVSFLFVVLIGFLIDSWFYGEVVFTPWNYFHKNIIEGVAAGFGTSPWYFYILKLFSYPSYFVGIPIVLSILVLLISQPKNLIVWCVVPFVFFHSIIAHKEERFLFPIIYFFPLILIESYLILKKIIRHAFLIKGINYLMTLIFLSVNSIGLLAIAQKPVGNGVVGIAKYIHDNYGEKPIHLVYCPWSNPYNPWGSIPIKFYMENDLTDFEIGSLCELDDSLFHKDVVNLLVSRKIEKENTLCLSNLNNNKYKFETQSIPKWIEKLNSQYKGFDNRIVLELYRYKYDSQ